MKNFNEEKERLKKQLLRIKNIRKEINERLTAVQLKAMKGFEHLREDVAEDLVKQLEEYALIVLGQINRLK